MMTTQTIFICLVICHFLQIMAVQAVLIADLLVLGNRRKARREGPHSDSAGTQKEQKNNTK